MKHIMLLLACCGALPLHLAQAQQFRLPIEVSDGTKAITVTLGADPNGTEGEDPGLDVAAPPPPPSGALDARFSNATGDYLTDIRAATAVQKTFDLRYTPQAATDRIVLRWDPHQAAAYGTLRLVDAFTGTKVGPIDMGVTGQFDTSTSPFTSGGLTRVRILMTGGSNAPPRAEDDAARTARDTALDIVVLANDHDPEAQPLTVTAVTQPPQGTATPRSDGTIRFAPTSGFTGNAGFTYTISDGLSTASAEVTVAVGTETLRAPVAAADAFPTDEDQPADLAVLLNDHDPNGGKLTITNLTQPVHGTATVRDGTSIRYEPAPDYFGADTFTYTVRNAAGLTAQATVTLTLRAVDDPPAFLSDGGITHPEAGAQIVVGGRENTPPQDLSAPLFDVTWDSARDVDGDPVTYTWALAPDASFGTTLLAVSDLTQPTLNVTVGRMLALFESSARLGQALTLYHRVVASDGHSTVAGPAQTLTLIRGTITGTMPDAALPDRFRLAGNFPNPFNPTTAVRFDLPTAAAVRLDVYDLSGRRVLSVPARAFPAGADHAIRIQAAGLPSGVYVYRLAAYTTHEVLQATARMVLVK